MHLYTPAHARLLITSFSTDTHDEGQWKRKTNYSLFVPPLFQSPQEAVFLGPDGFLYKVTCWVVVLAEETREILTMKKVMNEVKKLNKGMDNKILINSPTTNDLEECCMRKALSCFQSKQFLIKQLPGKDSIKNSQLIIKRELSKTFIVKSASDCSQQEIEGAQCKSCDSYPMVDSQTFVQNFQTFLQKIFVKLQESKV